MKKIIVTAILLVLTLPFSAAAKQINVVGGVGFAFSDIEGVLLEVGAEMRMAKGFYLQLGLNSYLNDQVFGNHYFFYGGSLHSPTTLSSRPYGLNFFGLYKVKVSGKISVFGKAGLHAMFRLRSRYNDYYYDGYYSGGGYYDEYGGYYYDDSGPDKTGMGAGFGLGIEHELSKKLALRVGGTYKILTATDGDSSWFKLYTALSYRVK